MDPDRSITLSLALLALLLAANAALLLVQLRALRAGTPLPWLGRWRTMPPESASARPVRAITTALSAADLAPEDHAIVHKAITFSDKSVGAVMVPRPDMVCVRAETPLRDILVTAASSFHSRLPVYAENLDHIVGFVHAKDLLRLSMDLSSPLRARDLIRPILAVPETKPIDDMLREFQDRKTHVAIVIDEFGGTSGMVTINDLLEELVGELFDEVRQSPPELESLADGRVRLSGRMSIVAVNERLGLTLPYDEFNTIAGLVFGSLGRTPAPGDCAEIHGIRFQVEATNGRRATQLVLEPRAAQSP